MSTWGHNRPSHGNVQCVTGSPSQAQSGMYSQFFVTTEQERTKLISIYPSPKTFHSDFLFYFLYSLPPVKDLMAFIIHVVYFIIG